MREPEWAAFLYPLGLSGGELPPLAPPSLAPGCPNILDICATLPVVLRRLVPEDEGRLGRVAPFLTVVEEEGLAGGVVELSVDLCLVIMGGVGVVGVVTLGGGGLTRLLGVVLTTVVLGGAGLGGGGADTSSYKSSSSSMGCPPGPRVISEYSSPSSSSSPAPSGTISSYSSSQLITLGSGFLGGGRVIVSTSSYVSSSSRGAITSSYNSSSIGGGSRLPMGGDGRGASYSCGSSCLEGRGGREGAGADTTGTLRGGREGGWKVGSAGGPL